ncbi:MAG: 3-oxoacid CoA-transferase subunit B [Candidatus Accumulibacter sp.]|jgi:acetate CoA/acetoacetate CoA-transferase beta subunit|nr:3-oxoacid CoA-transferase subunit B [Accumulibacter sp.]
MNSKELIACRVAQEFKNGEMVNLGAGIPNLAVKYIKEGVKIYLQAENGIVGCGPHDPSKPIDLFSTDAGENPVSIIPGGAIVDSCTSFGLIRGRHLSTSVLGAMQVDIEGNLANWMVPGGKIAGMGGAMDLVCGAKRVIATMEHCTKDGSPKILKRCTYPLTGQKVVSMIITELSVFMVTPQGLVLTETAPGVSVQEIRQKTEASFEVSSDLQEMVLN